jgi:hypothetical protein
MTLNASELLEQEFLPLRAKVLEVAAILDRLQRSTGESADSDSPPNRSACNSDASPSDDPRMAQVRQAIHLLLEVVPDRAEQIQLIFSLPYDADWRGRYQLNGRLDH